MTRVPPPKPASEDGASKRVRRRAESVALVLWLVGFAVFVAAHFDAAFMDWGLYVGWAIFGLAVLLLCADWTLRIRRETGSWATTYSTWASIPRSRFWDSYFSGMTNLICLFLAAGLMWAGLGTLFGPHETRRWGGLTACLLGIGVAFAMYLYLRRPVQKRDG